MRPERKPTSMSPARIRQTIGTWDQNMLFVGRDQRRFPLPRTAASRRSSARMADAVLYVDRLDYEQNMGKLQDVEILHENAGYFIVR